MAPQTQVWTGTENAADRVEEAVQSRPQVIVVCALHQLGEGDRHERAEQVLSCRGQEVLRVGGQIVAPGRLTGRVAHVDEEMAVLVDPPTARAQPVELGR
jgi:methylmalonyl-CoA mutase cobalamin-binding subunit